MTRLLSDNGVSADVDNRCSEKCLEHNLADRNQAYLCSSPAEMYEVEATMKPSSAKLMTKIVHTLQTRCMLGYSNSMTVEAA
jgi:hypothetical protein